MNIQSKEKKLPITLTVVLHSLKWPGNSLSEPKIFHRESTLPIIIDLISPIETILEA